MSKNIINKQKPLQSSLKKVCAAAVSVSLLAATLILTPPTDRAAAATIPNDIDSHWAKPYIERAIQDGLAKGYEDGSFRPQNHVTEAEFLAMLLRAYGVITPKDEHGSTWSYVYYTYGLELGWPLSFHNERGSFKRGQVANLLAVSVNGKAFGASESVQWLLDEGISQGRGSTPTIEGFAPQGNLTRAEALTFIYNVKAYTGSLSDKAVPKAAKPAVQDISIGDRADKLASLLGKPARVLAGEADSQWHIYHKDSRNFAMYGVAGGTVSAMYTMIPDLWHSASALRLGMTFGEAISAGGLTGSPNNDEYQYSRDGVQTTLFLDSHDRNKLIGVLVESADLQRPSNTSLSSAVLSDMELLLFELASAERVKRGVSPLIWDAKAAASARGHSKDMVARKFFRHENPDGASPFVRMKAQGITYGNAAENIAEGYADSLRAHYGWINSEGHRLNVLNDKLQRLGTGIAQKLEKTSRGTQSTLYYTQNFYTPL